VSKLFPEQLLKNQELFADICSSVQEAHNITCSALVSTYNSERYIHGCLEDLTEQSLYKQGKLEILVIDSNSQENESEIVKQFQRQYKNISYYRTKEREPLYAAWNRGIALANGKYLTNANTDDRHAPDALEILANALDLDPESVLAYGDLIVTTQINERFNRCSVHSYIEYPDFNRNYQVHFGQCGPQPMWRKKLHLEYGLFYEGFQICADYEWWLRLSRLEKFVHIPKLLGLYLDSPTSVEHRKPEETQFETDTIRNFYARASGIKLDHGVYRNECIRPFYRRYRTDLNSLSLIVLNSQRYSVERIAELAKGLEIYPGLEIILPRSDSISLSQLCVANKNLHIRQISIGQNYTDWESASVGALHASSGWIVFITDLSQFILSDIGIVIEKLGHQTSTIFIAESATKLKETAIENLLQNNKVYLQSSLLETFKTDFNMAEVVNVLQRISAKIQEVISV
jgi:glycosyltransferase involved in cell wall biosynthesis